MATKNYLFTGLTKWAKVRKPDEKYDNYQVPLYMDAPSWENFKESGCQLRTKEDEDGKFVVFKRRHMEYHAGKKQQIENGPPPVKILDKATGELADFPDKLIGNGSLITVQVELYDTPKRGPGTKGHRLIGVIVNDLVPYGDDELPVTEEAVVKMPF